MLAPVASYVRRYLQASVEHEIRVLSADVRAVRAQLDVALQQNERLAGALARLDNHARFLSALATNGTLFLQLEAVIWLVTEDQSVLAAPFMTGGCDGLQCL